ncbi:hypothetical protein SDC9_193424 [bioreactor metagenome]|uniref:Uncharacterized protein n=1 Tax=bioreactor metagenome TaxID=1076179 RepID=A0A645I629_9ZZZZ
MAEVYVGIEHFARIDGLTGVSVRLKGVALCHEAGPRPCAVDLIADRGAAYDRQPRRRTKGRHRRRYRFGAADAGKSAEGDRHVWFHKGCGLFGPHDFLPQGCR